MSDLIRDIKGRLKVEDVIQSEGAEFQLRARGRYLEGRAHDSLKINPVKQNWRWYSQDDQARGDVLDWIAWRSFGRNTHALEPERFVKVLEMAAAKAGLDFASYQIAKDKENHQRWQENRKRRQSILERYLECGLKSWTPATRALCFARKKWLTDEILERWKIFNAPNQTQLEKAGLSVAELLEVGLARYARRPGGSPEGSASQGRTPCDEGSGWDDVYLHFKDCFVVPFFEYGRLVYFSSRRYRDENEFGKKLNGPKCKHMPSPDQGSGVGGVKARAGFNLDALHDLEALREKGLLLVEGPWDAIACCERGHPAVAILSTSLNENLIEAIQRLPVDIERYLLLDSDQTTEQRFKCAAKVGYLCRVARLEQPDDEVQICDPDELSAEQLQQYKESSLPVIEEGVCWLDECLSGV